ncbi:MAG TPA: integration host factor, actinobacterial type [Miltoncostaeaceae bacterium]|nr:integration host factor, actinobacterial type [Miltoncostaeaceae bacterium]
MREIFVKIAANPALPALQRRPYSAASMTSSIKAPTQAPERSLDQRMEALRRANEIRSQRAQLKKDLKTGKVHIREIIQSPPDYVMTAKVFDMLLAVPKYGKVKATRFINHCRISQGKTVGGLSERQRNELMELLNR